MPEQTGEAATVSAEENSEAPIPETGEEAADTTDNPVQNSSDGTAGAETSTPFSRVKNLINNLTESVGTKNHAGTGNSRLFQRRSRRLSPGRRTRSSPRAVT